MIASRVSQDGVRTGHNIAQLSIRAMCLHHCLLLCIQSCESNGVE